MNILFTPAKIGNLEIPNRFVRSATYDAGADNGFVSDWQLDLYGALAKGRVGLIISAAFNIRDGRAVPVLNSLTDDKFVPGLRRLTDTVHANGSRLAVQVYHAGRDAYRVLQPVGMEATGPSGFKAGEDPYFKGTCREMTEEEIGQRWRPSARRPAGSRKPAVTQFSSMVPMPIYSPSFFRPTAITARTTGAVGWKIGSGCTRRYTELPAGRWGHSIR